MAGRVAEVDLGMHEQGAGVAGELPWGGGEVAEVDDGPGRRDREADAVVVDASPVGGHRGSGGGGGDDDRRRRGHGGRDAAAERAEGGEAYAERGHVEHPPLRPARNPHLQPVDDTGSPPRRPGQRDDHHRVGGVGPGPGVAAAGGDTDLGGASPTDPVRHDQAVGGNGEIYRPDRRPTPAHRCLRQGHRRERRLLRRSDLNRCRPGPGDHDARHHRSGDRHGRAGTASDTAAHRPATATAALDQGSNRRGLGRQAIDEAANFGLQVDHNTLSSSWSPRAAANAARAFAVVADTAPRLIPSAAAISASGRSSA